MTETLEALELSAQDYRDASRMTDPEVKLYKWEPIPGTHDFRPRCLPCDQPMRWAMEIRREYPDTLNKTSLRNGKHQVFYKGRLVQVHKCRGCGQSVVK